MTTLYTWETWGVLPHPTLLHATNSRPPQQEAQTRRRTHLRARGPTPTRRTTQLPHPPGRPHHPVHGRRPHKGVRRQPQPHNHGHQHGLPGADAVLITQKRTNARVVARLNYTQPHKLKRTVGPFAVYITPHGIDQPRFEHHNPPYSTPCSSSLHQTLPARTISGIMYLGTVPGDPGIYILPSRSRKHAMPLHRVESLALRPPPPKHYHQHIPGDKRTISGIMYLGTVPGDPGIYILPSRSRKHAMPLHRVESLALRPPPPKHYHQHIPGDKRSQATDG